MGGRKREGEAIENGRGEREERQKNIESRAGEGSGLEAAMHVYGGECMLLARLKAFYNFVLSCQALS